MAVSAAWLKVDGERLAESLIEISATLNGAEVVLDFSAIDRVDAAALKALEKLAGAADDAGIPVVLAGVNARVYKALKLMKVSARFSYL